MPLCLKLLARASFARAALRALVILSISPSLSVASLGTPRVSAARSSAAQSDSTRFSTGSASRARIVSSLLANYMKPSST